MREFTSVQAVREQIVQIVEEYIKDNPRSDNRAAESLSISAPPTSWSCPLRLWPTICESFPTAWRT